MKLIFRSMRKYRGSIAIAVFLKLIGTLSELCSDSSCISRASIVATELR